MNVERLRHMQEILRRPLPTGTGFDLGIWNGSLDAFYEAEGNNDPAEATPECGTVCCAIGLAMNDPDFQALGLIKLEVPEIDRDQGFNNNEFEPIFDGSEGFEAVARFFDIDTSQAVHIFSIGSYNPLDRRPTRQDVIDRIDQYLVVHA